MFINSIMATSTTIKINSVMATSTSIKGCRPVPWKKAKTRRTVPNAEINFRRHLCSVADDDSPVESRSADQNHILIAVVARELHGDKPTFWVLDGFTTFKNTYPHLCRSTVRRLMEKWAAQECVIGLIISVRLGSERPVVDM